MQGGLPQRAKRKQEKAAAFFLPLGELITGQQAPCTGECLGPATLALAGTWAGHRPLLGRGMSWGWGRVLGREQMPEPSAEGHSRPLGSADQRTAHVRQRGHE